VKRREFVRPLGGVATGWSLAARGHMATPFAGHAPIRGKTARDMILPIGLSLALILLTSLVLAQIHSHLTALGIWHDPEDLALAYLLPTIFIAVFFGSTVAVITSLASGVAAAYFVYPPQFSLLFDHPQEHCRARLHPRAGDNGQQGGCRHNRRQAAGVAQLQG
jgi:Domain of unknown function (DUF4118)